MVIKYMEIIDYNKERYLKQSHPTIKPLIVFKAVILLQGSSIFVLNNDFYLDREENEKEVLLSTISLNVRGLEKRVR